MTNTSGTALITGASSGIGESYARKLAALGYNLIITARRAELLYKIAGELEEKYNISVKTIPADLAMVSDIEILENIIRDSSGIDMLINNAGFGTRRSFKSVEIQRHEAMMNVHLQATMRLTYAVIPGMLKKNKGVIINVSSLAGVMPIAGVVYSSTKTFLNTFSRLLQNELRGTGIKVQALCPGFTYSGFHDTEDFENWDRKSLPGVLWMSSDSVVDYSIKNLLKNKTIVIPGFVNRFSASSTS